MDEARIDILKNGPYRVSGSVPLSEKVIVATKGHYEYREGRELPQAKTYLLCRCGKSSTMPFCDGTHVHAGFDGTEAASRESYAQRASVSEGPELTLLDDGRCALARFCHRDEGNVWELTQCSDDPHLKAEAIRASMDCPSGRLVHIDKATGKQMEPDLAPAIEVLQDPEKGVSGPLFVKGGVLLVGSDGVAYEERNRMTLCRCGQSHNKPFCDAVHARVGFQDGKYAF